MADQGRIVVVSAGFALWLGGRCIAAARWSDVATARAYRRDRVATGPICVALRLRDGSEVELQEGAPGWPQFLAVAHARLPGMPRPEGWLAAVEDPAFGGNEVLLFERPGARA